MRRSESKAVPKRCLLSWDKHLTPERLSDNPEEDILRMFSDVVNVGNLLPPSRPPPGRFESPQVTLFTYQI